MSNKEVIQVNLAAANPNLSPATRVGRRMVSSPAFFIVSGFEGTMRTVTERVFSGIDPGKLTGFGKSATLAHDWRNRTKPLKRKRHLYTFISEGAAIVVDP